MGIHKDHKGSKLYSEPDRRWVKNTKPVEYSRNSKIWAVGEIIEVDQNEADSLHKEGFLVMDEDDMADQKEKSETVLNPDE